MDQGTSDGTLGERLRELLAERGMSLGELSRRSHYDKGYLSKVMNGRKAASEPLARCLDELLGAGGELAVLVPAPAPAAVRAAAGVPPPTTAQQLAVMSGQIEALRAEVGALTEVVTFAVLGIPPAGVAGGKTPAQPPGDQ